MGFKQVSGDPCLYAASQGEMFLIAVYVDDILLAGKFDQRISSFKRALSERFKVKDMGELHHFLGVKVVQDHNTGNVWIGQEVYTENILRHFGMDEAKSIRTPVDTSTKLVQAGEKDSMIDQSNQLLRVQYTYLLQQGLTSHAVNNVAKFCARPTGAALGRCQAYLSILKVTVTRLAN